MLNEHNEEKIKLICDYLSEDIDALACQEMMEHLKNCPTCKVYFDTVRKTVILCKEIDCPEKLPEDVNNRLLKVLDLDNVKWKPAE